MCIRDRYQRRVRETVAPKMLCILGLFLTLASVLGATMPFSVLQYNLFGRPYTVSHDGQNERLERMPAAVLAIEPDIDVACFAEADNDQERDLLAAAFAKAGYNHRTSVVVDHEHKSLINGGVLIGSKWPILREDQIVYRHDCSGSDCLAAKGAKYARVIKTVNNVSKIFNVFATHMQAWYSPQDLKDRVEQAEQLRQFIDTQQIDRSEPVLISGDFNTDLVRYPGEVHSLLHALNATLPELVGAQRYTSDPSSNLLVGRDGAAGTCNSAYEKSWGPRANKSFNPTDSTRVPSTNAWPPHTDTGDAVLPFFTAPNGSAYCACCPSEWLDYVLASAGHQQPVGNPTLEALPVTADVPFSVPWSGALQPVPEPPVVGSYMVMSDLSDHYPVHGSFEFEVTGPAVLGVDGCRNDSDCTAHASLRSTCYCDGPGCTWKGAHVNGWKQGAADPVNDNCHFSVASSECLCHKE
eukprot:TRINITY_DN45410_c0_g1_i1.p1 TRINITY_DN45410_c0_g1~~TRINITY_DN45410_c0_g1_i1.p1  ORF type:complete len:467 (-),score=64.91 TRINITY_DN45410_c0_g1_i1:186-1586(-)